MMPLDGDSATGLLHKEVTTVPTPEQLWAALQPSCSVEDLRMLEQCLTRLIAAIDHVEQTHAPAKIFEVANEVREP